MPISCHTGKVCQGNDRMFFLDRMVPGQDINPKKIELDLSAYEEGQSFKVVNLRPPVRTHRQNSAASSHGIKVEMLNL